MSEKRIFVRLVSVTGPRTPTADAVEALRLQLPAYLKVHNTVYRVDIPTKRAEVTKGT